MRLSFFIFALFISWILQGQQNSIKGHIIEDKGEPLVYATVALLNPIDSTLDYFGVSNSEGQFVIKDIKPGKYLFQVAYLGFQTINRSIIIPYKDQGELGAIVMKASTVNLKETEIIADRIPILIKKDSIEYDAAAFKTKPDAVVEDLLKKLPGVEVDRSGNIKAQGEKVKNVLVDGKEFFGNDPKIATKNLPADAIKKVQVYDKKSEEAELTGIDDGSRDKTINLLLKDGKKKAWIGDLMGGVGSGEHYQVSTKAYRFTKQTQFALLGMLNNINQFGFSFKDYIDFNGGIGNYMGGGGGFRMTVNNENSFPINFGQPVTGFITSGAGGLNYSYEKSIGNRFNISYLGNGADKKLNEDSYAKYFTDNTPFIQNDKLNQKNSNRAHRINFGSRNKLDSISNLIISGDIALTKGNTIQNSYSESLKSDYLINNQTGDNSNNSNGISSNASVDYLKKGNNNWKLFKISGLFYGAYSLSKTQWNNLTNYFSTNEIYNINQFQNNRKDLYKYNLKTSLTRYLGKQYYLVPELEMDGFNERLNREQGIPPGNEVLVDSLSPHFTNTYFSLKPGITFKKSNKKIQFTITAKFETGIQRNQIIGKNSFENRTVYFIPKLGFENEYSRSHHYNIYYNAFLNNPDANQLLSIIDNSNSLQLYQGNQKLRPEYIHDVRINWIIFDEFTFTSMFAGIHGSYTKDKINFSRNIEANLSQLIGLVNVKNDYVLDGNIDFSTPIKKLGLNLHANAKETWNRGINLVDGIENINTNLRHDLSLSFDNRKKNIWDVNIGASISLTNSTYSLQKSLDNNYFSYAYFSEFNYTPTEKWHLSLSGEITHYNSSGFNQSIDIPLLKASFSHYFLNGNRGVISLDIFDILNKNSGINRISELNYLVQKTSNIIGRYAMLSFKYRLNKFENKSPINIEINH